MINDRIDWSWRGQTVSLGVDTHGRGPFVLMLPALSSISTRTEMRALAEVLGLGFTTIAVDWPGFGN